MAHTFQIPSREPESRTAAHHTEVFPQEAYVTKMMEMPAWMPEAMEPGCLFLLARRFQLSAKREPRLVAVLACPQCGMLNMITEAQYGGQSAVVCESELCGQHFFIRDKSWFEYLPLH